MSPVQCHDRNSDNSPPSIAGSSTVRFIILPILPSAGTLTATSTTRLVSPYHVVHFLYIYEERYVISPACSNHQTTMPAVYLDIVFAKQNSFFCPNPCSTLVSRCPNYYSFIKIPEKLPSHSYLAGCFYRLSKRGWGSLKKIPDWARDTLNSSPSREKMYVPPVGWVFNGMYQHRTGGNDE